MGNEGSMLQGLEVDPQPLENTDEWTVHAASSTCAATPQLTVFAARHTSDLAGVYSLERAAKKLKIYRHPNILKYISSWTQQGRLCMATESVKPLTRVLISQTPLQICVGLHDVLKALVFLHEKAQSSHNNICCAAVYVTSDGSWKLGGLEFMCRFTELNSDFLQKTRPRRYEKAVPPEEDNAKALEPKAIDTYAFGILVEDVLKKNPDDAQVPGMKDFRDMCRKQLQNSEPSLRPKLSNLLEQPLFNHKFVYVHDFLTELPVKSDSEKATFFRNLASQLQEFPENLVASQLGALLLARIVLLDHTAQEHLLPRLLHPQLESDSGKESSDALFTMGTYQQYVVPRLLHIFCVRDVQVRLLLLEHFPHYCTAFNKEQLSSKVLPELLLGIKDTDDNLVASTLRAVALLVPLLGAATVIGGKRTRLFTDGRPKARQPPALPIAARQRTKDRPESVTRQTFHAEESTAALSLADLPERPSPDGGEDLTSATPVDEETDAWSDWEVNDTQVGIGFIEQNTFEAERSNSPLTSDHTAVKTEASKSNHVHSSLDLGAPSQATSAHLSATLPDIMSLDIKSSLSVPKHKLSISEEFDFFQDMEPVISKTHVLQVDDVPKSSSSYFDIDLNAMGSTVGEAGEGWGDIDNWGNDSDSELTVT